MSLLVMGKTVTLEKNKNIICELNLGITHH